MFSFVSFFHSGPPHRTALHCTATQPSLAFAFAFAFSQRKVNGNGNGGLALSNLPGYLIWMGAGLGEGTGVIRDEFKSDFYWLLVLCVCFILRGMKLNRDESD